jgi:hypothetical protein
MVPRNGFRVTRPEPNRKADSGLPTGREEQVNRMEDGCRTVGRL